jgi:hypothetical protein
MAFALTSFLADGVRFMGPGPLAATQTYRFTITGAATDVDLDVGDTTGTFWTDAQADTTYGAMAALVLAQVDRLVDQYSSVKSVYMPQLIDRIQVASSPTGTQYSADGIDTATLLPSYTFAASGGETSYTLAVEYFLDPTILPANLSYNVQIP